MGWVDPGWVGPVRVGVLEVDLLRVDPCWGCVLRVVGVRVGPGVPQVVSGTVAVPSLQI